MVGKPQMNPEEAPAWQRRHVDLGELVQFLIPPIKLCILI